MVRRLLAPTPLLLFVLGSLASGSAARAAALPPPSVGISYVRVSEGDAGLTTFEARVGYSSYGPIAGPPSIEVDITAQAGTASADDFVFTPVHVTLALGQTVLISGAVVGDRTFEGDETFTLVPTVTSAGFTQAGPGVVTITDDDQAVAPKLSVDAITTVPEGNDGWHAVGVRVQLQPGVTSVVEVDFMAAADNVPGLPLGSGPVIERLSFAPGETSKLIPIQIRGDKVWENDRTIPVWLANPLRAVLGNAMGNLVVKNDDVGAALVIDDMTLTEGNAGTSTAMVRLRFDPPAPGGGKVHLTIKGGSAVDGEDFTNGGFHVIYPIGGEKEMTFPLEIVGDTRPECDEGLAIEYRGVYLGDDTTKTARLTIIDDDGGPKTGCPDLFTPSGNPPVLPPPDAGTPPAQDASSPPADPGKTVPPATPDAGSSTSTGAAGTSPTPGGQATGAAGTAGSVGGDKLPDRGCTVGSGRVSTPSALLLGVLVAASLRLRRRRGAR